MNAAPAREGIPAYKDRRAGCVVFGVINIFIGCDCTLMALLIALSPLVLPKLERLRSIQTDANYFVQLPNIQTNPGHLAMAALFLLALAVVFIWLGLGSVHCRRWARTLTLILAWSWLMLGVIDLAVCAFMLPSFLELLPFGPLKTVMLVVILSYIVVVYIALPGGMIIFYQNKHVQATFAARDPKVCWTDLCPLPVLTTAVWFVIGALLSLLAAPFVRMALPFFGRFMTGWPAAAMTVVLAVVFIWLGWAYYRLQISGWWVSLVVVAVMSVSTVVTLMRVDFLEMYRLMGYPEDEIAALRRIDFFSGPTMFWLTALMSAAMVGFLFWIKSFFTKRRSLNYR